MSDGVWKFGTIDDGEIGDWIEGWTKRWIDRRLASGLYSDDEARRFTEAVLSRNMSNGQLRSGLVPVALEFEGQVTGGALFMVPSGPQSGGVVLDEIFVTTRREGDVAAWRTLAERFGRDHGATALQVTVFSGDALARDFVVDAEFDLVASKMIRRLNGTEALANPPGAVRLDPMTTTEFESFREHLISTYADDMARAGSISAQQAREASEQQTAELLPEGELTDLQFLFVARHDGEHVGIVWLHDEFRGGAQCGFVYDVEIVESFRGRGFGRQVMVAAEEFFRHRGDELIELNVFGFNDVARSLYLKIGYAISEEFFTAPIK